MRRKSIERKKREAAPCLNTNDTKRMWGGGEKPKEKVEEVEKSVSWNLSFPFVVFALFISLFASLSLLWYIIRQILFDLLIFSFFYASH